MELGVLKRTVWIHKVSGRAGIFGLTGVLLLTGMLLPGKVILAEEGSGEYPGQSPQEEVCPIYYDAWTGSREDIMELEGEEIEYRVLPGDCLWEIAEKLWGDGRWYDRLSLANGEEMKDKNLIYPGMMLRAVSKGYLRKSHTQNAGMQTEKYAIHTPGIWTVGMISGGDASANLVFSGEGLNRIMCLVQDKKEETVLTTRNWEECAGKIRQYAQECYEESVSDLSFEHYRMAEGEEIYLYSFLWQMELPDHPEVGRVGIRACMGLKLTEHIQAEFLGFASSYDIRGGVRYTTAAFEERADEYDPATFTVNDSNMSMLPEAEWELEGLYDPFSWLDAFFGALSEKAAGVEPEPESSREGLIEKIGKPGGRRN